MVFKGRTEKRIKSNKTLKRREESGSECFLFLRNRNQVTMAGSQRGRQEWGGLGRQQPGHVGLGGCEMSTEDHGKLWKNWVMYVCLFFWWERVWIPRFAFQKENGRVTVKREWLQSPKWPDQEGEVGRSGWIWDTFWRQNLQWVGLGKHLGDDRKGEDQDAALIKVLRINSSGNSKVYL